MILEEILKENKIDIREDETRKTQALEQIRQRLNKHPFLKRCRQDDTFLLAFLRTRKYSIDATIKSIEKNFILRSQRPEWFEITPSSTEEMKAIIRSKYCYYLKDLDSCGRKVLMMNAANMDVEKFSSNNIFNCAFIATASSLEYDVTQIIGFNLVLNYKNTSMVYFSKFTIAEIADWVKSLEALPGRYKKFFVIGLPSFGNAFLNVAKLTMSEKQRDRIVLLNDEKEVAEHINPSILPERFGGTQSEDEIAENCIKVLEENLDKLKMSNDFEIDETIASYKDQITETVGSFRKLEID